MSSVWCSFNFNSCRQACESRPCAKTYSLNDDDALLLNEIDVAKKCPSEFLALDDLPWTKKDDLGQITPDCIQVSVIGKEGITNTVSNTELPCENDSDENGFAVDFWDGSQMKHVVFKTVPWGLSFLNEAPLVVSCVDSDSHASALGVKVGWELKNLESHALDGKDFTADHQSLIAAARSHLFIEFWYEDVIATVCFKTKPLGLVFENEVPITVKEVIAGGIAEKRGVKVGWVFKKINGRLLEGRDYSEDLRLLLKTARLLPTLDAAASNS